ncbi:hypothetical protein [Priestia aryabhattai]|uniref:hypothetical protein n=1 Tax=Priestia aryabhattai TaxID=412384 RepID=UPI001594DA33
MASRKKNRGFQAILKNGSDYEKALLVANSNAEKATSGKGFLTEYEIRELMSTIQNNKGANIYNSIMNIENNIRLAVYDMENEYCFFENRFWMYYFFYNRYSLITEIPDSLNSFLYEYPETREFLLKCMKINSIEFCPSSDEMFIEARMKPELNEMRIRVANGLDSARIRIKTVATCIKDYMEEKRVFIETYLKKVQELEEKVRQAGFPSENEQYRTIKQSNKELIDKIIYDDGIIVFPAYNDLPIEKKYYQKFRRQSIEGVYHE